MASEEQNLLILIAKAASINRKIASGRYQASAARKSFPAKFTVIVKQRNHWTSLLKRYGLSADMFVGPSLEKTCELLDSQQKKLDRLQSSCNMLQRRRLKFSESLSQSMDSVIKALQELPENLLLQGKAAKGLQQATLTQVTTSPFQTDPTHVPLDKTVSTTVREALERETTGLDKATELTDHDGDKLLDVHETMIAPTEASEEGLLLRNIFGGSAVKMGSVQKSIEPLVGLLTRHGTLPSLQNAAMFTLGIVSSNVENAKTICSCPHAIERLVGFLHEEVPPDVQAAAASTLGRISRKVVENAMKVGSFPRAIESLVGLLRNEVSPAVKRNATLTLAELSKNVVENARKVGAFPNAIDRLVRLLQEGVSPDVRGPAAYALGFLSKEVVENATKIGSCPTAIEALVGLLEEEVSPRLRAEAALTLGRLSMNVEGNATKVAAVPNAIERLVGLLRRDVRPALQKPAAFTLGQLSKNVVENARKIVSFPGAIERLVGLLQGDVSRPVREQAAQTLGLISRQVPEIAREIGLYPNAIERLVGLLAEDSGLQNAGAYALSTLSLWALPNRKILAKAISEAPKALEGLLECAKSEKYGGSGKRQYWASQVCFFADVVEGDKTGYQSREAYEGERDARAVARDYEGALEAYERGSAIDFEHRSLIGKKCCVKAKLGDFEGALADADKFVEEDDDKSLGLQERGVLKRMMGDLSGALADLNEALDLEPDDYEMLKHRGYVKFLLLDEDGARADAKLALQAKPSKVDLASYGKYPVLGTAPVEYLSFKLK